jgi:HK97 family phage major capsid protein
MNTREVLARNAELKAQAESIYATAQKEGFSDELKAKFAGIRAELNKNEELIQMAAEIGSFKSGLASVGSHEDAKTGRDSKEYEAAFKQYVMSRGRVVPEILATNMGVADNTADGVAVPSSFESQIVQLADQDNAARQLSSVTSTAVDVYYPNESATGSAAVTSEGSAYNASNPTLGNKKLGAHKFTQKVLVTEELFQDFNQFQSYVTSRAGRNLAVAEEAKFINGAGTTEPEGYLPFATEGTVTASSTVIDFLTDLNDTIAALKSQYRKGASWLMNRSTYSTLRKAVASTSGVPMWPYNDPTLLGFPVSLSDEMPDIAAAAKPILFGNFNAAALIGNRGSVQIKIDDISAADSGVVKILAKRRSDQVVLLPEAIKYLQIKSA